MLLDVARRRGAGVRAAAAVVGLAAVAISGIGCGSSAGDAMASTATRAPAGAAAVAQAPTPTVAPPTATQAATRPSPTETKPTAQPTPSATATAAATSTRAPVPTPAASGATVAVRREFAPEFAMAERTGVEMAADGKALAIAKDGGAFLAKGELVSEVRRPGVAFDNLVLSWNAAAPAGTGLEFYARVLVEGAWTGWYAMGVWRDGKGASVRGQSDATGRVEVDTLVLSRPAEAWQYRVVLTSADGRASPRLRSVAVAVADRKKAPTGPAVEVPEGWVRELPVPVESQAIQDPSVAWEICSPTSLTMALRYWGVQTTVAETYRGVRDGTTGIYGNWPLNTAYAAAHGLDAYVARMYSLDQVRAEIAAGRPVIVSVKYGAGELPGAALPSTSGHIILVRGFTADGEAIINDPAGLDKSSVRRVVKADDLERVWLRSGGIAYLIAPEG